MIEKTQIVPLSYLSGGVLPGTACNMAMDETLASDASTLLAFLPTSADRELHARRTVIRPVDDKLTEVFDAALQPEIRTDRIERIRPNERGGIGQLIGLGVVVGLWLQLVLFPPLVG